MSDYRRNLSKSVCEGLLGAGSYKSIPSIRDSAVIRYGDELHVKYNETSVAVFLPNGDIRLNSGDWRTVTTKSRINACLWGTGWYLYQKDHNWFVSNGKVDITFTDGMEVASE